eukprot:TRINITY_DN16047_c0_g1_i1.p1 TRINITY_DN16047_c0_g1~~TRINITY_DN16047_c0_g1_i1.p1  ORF type:complete len:360 (+),score=102.41 TRINITY_DN16047_c0_g1_i1:82-1161(+)
MQQPAARGGYSGGPSSSGGGGVLRPAQVLVLGDSWAKYMWPCWPQRVAEALSVPCFNFAVPGATTSDVHLQLNALRQAPHVLRADGGKLVPSTLAIVHTGGNDFLRRFGTDLLRLNPGEPEARKLGELLEGLSAAGCNDFLVSDVPLSPAVPMVRIGLPMLAGAIQQGMYRDMGIDPGEDPNLVLQVQQTALHDAWEAAIDRFRAAHSGVRVAHFNEAAALLRLTEGAASAQHMWDFTQFHPSEHGHRRLAEEAVACLRLSFGGARQQPSSPATAAPSPAAPSAVPALRPLRAAAYTAAAAAALTAAVAGAARPVRELIAALESAKRLAFQEKDFARCKELHAEIVRLQAEAAAEMRER